MRAIFATAMVIFSKKPFQKIVGDNYVKALRSWLKFLLNNYEAHWQQHFERHPTVEDFRDMDRRTCWLFHQGFSKDHETKMKKIPWKLSFTQKMRSRSSKNIVPKYMIFHLFLYASFSLKQTWFLDLTQCVSSCHSLFKFLPFRVWYSTDFEVYPLQTSKN